MEYSSLTDEHLLQLLKESDEKAFAALYDRYWADSYRQAMKIVRSDIDAEDIIQELFISIWKRREDLDIRNGLPGYLYTSTKYLSIHFISRNMAASGYLSSFSEHMEPVVHPSVESGMDARQLEKTINLVVEKMPDKMKEVFRLSRGEHLTHREIAERLHISEETVKKQVYNALKFIRQHMGTLSIGIIISIVYTLQK